ncbi:hypothetical protein LQ327_01250 [Actinomycetospora endophytica]|uniref:Lipoprotein n=1 Tax=Actinomycetospora endophytica TaxID=2291215 RepID=A0ABS8P194_9PSEU|nr:hypothetical protein [Actinomycetospora endophytica]MCD2192017.1 hypothetical protein [Actinomycetospora endophytica]
MRRSVLATAGIVVLVLSACGAGSSVPHGVAFIDAVVARSPLEDGLATVVLPSSMNEANLLVAVAMGDGPGPGEANAEAQHTRLTDSAAHAWTLRDHHLVYGSIIDVYTAPGTGRENGATITSEMTVKTGDEGHSLSVLAYRNGRLESITRRNGSFGVPQLTQTVSRGTDVITAFGDGRKNIPATPVAGFRPLNVLPVDGGPRGDQDLYQLDRLDPPGSSPGGAMLTGNDAPPPSAYWGIVNVNIVPADPSDGG